jgi:regulation of enolase protein 1 (concanavalin A-like superfamily)
MGRLMPVTPIDSIPGVPAAFHWLGTPVAASLDNGVLSLTAGARTDWFVDPGSGQVTLNAPALACALPGNFTLSARVEAALESTFDAGALVLWQNDRTWAKLAFEFSPAGEAMVVSVVTRGDSDDCNSMVVGAPEIWLRVAYLGAAHAFHASTDGHNWQLVRHFRLSEAGTTEVGFEAQSPLGEGCRARFSQIEHAQRTLADLRNGD